MLSDKNIELAMKNNVELEIRFGYFAENGYFNTNVGRQNYEKIIKLKEFDEKRTTIER